MRAFETDCCGIKSIVWADDEAEAARVTSDAGLVQGFCIARERIIATPRPDLDDHPRKCRFRAFSPDCLGA
jgi:hypothetical protein